VKTITINGRELSQAAENAVKFVGKRNKDLENFLIAGDGYILKIAALSDPCYAEFYVPYNGDPVFFSVQANMLVKMLPKVNASLNIEVNDKEIVIKKKNGEVKIITNEPRFDFFEIGDENFITFETNELKRAVDFTKNSVATNEVYVAKSLQCLCLDNRNNKLVVIGSNSYAMSIYKTDIPFSNYLLVNPLSLAKASEILFLSGDKAEMFASAGQLKLKNDKCLFIFTPYEMKFPNWEDTVKMIENNIVAQFTIPTKKFKECLDRMKLIRKSYPRSTTKFHVSPIELRAIIEGETEYNEVIPLVSSSENVPEFSTDPEILFDIVSPITDANIIIEVPQNGNGIITIKPVDNEKICGFLGTMK